MVECVRGGSFFGRLFALQLCLCAVRGDGQQPRNWKVEMSVSIRMKTEIFEHWLADVALVTGSQQSLAAGVNIFAALSTRR